MILFVTTALPQLRAHAHPALGRLITPRHHPRLPDTLRDGWPVAADCDAYQAWDERRYLRLVKAIRAATGCPPAWPRPGAEPAATPQNFHWLTVPDIVGDAHATYRRFLEWERDLRGLPLAYVLQEGAERPGLIPWNTPNLRALFIGGKTDEWKLGPEPAAIAREARARGLLVHMGRVNSARRIEHARAIGCHSIDGTKWARWRDRYLNEGLELAANATPAETSMGPGRDDGALASQKRGRLRPA